MANCSELQVWHTPKFHECAEEFPKLEQSVSNSKFLQQFCGNEGFSLFDTPQSISSAFYSVRYTENYHHKSFSEVVQTKASYKHKATQNHDKAIKSYKRKATHNHDKAIKQSIYSARKKYLKGKMKLNNENSACVDNLLQTEQIPTFQHIKHRKREKDFNVTPVPTCNRFSLFAVECDNDLEISDDIEDLPHKNMSDGLKICKRIKYINRIYFCYALKLESTITEKQIVIESPRKFKYEHKLIKDVAKIFKSKKVFD